MKELEDLVRRLDEAMIIDGPAFAMFHQQYRQSGRRPAALAGRSYAATLRALRASSSSSSWARRGRRAGGRRRVRGVGVPRHPEPAHRLPARRPGLYLVVPGAGRAVPCRHVRHPGRRPSVLPSPFRPDPQGLRDAARHRPHRPLLRRSASPRWRAATSSTTSSRTGPSTRSSSRSSSSSICWAGAAISRSCRSWSARSTT